MNALLPVPELTDSERVGLPATATGTSKGSPVPALEGRLTAKAISLGAWRARTLKAARNLMRHREQPEGPSIPGLSQRATADLLGLSLTTLNRLVRDFEKLTDDQLTPENCAGATNNSGQTSEFAPLLRLPDVVTELNRLYVATMGASCDQATRGRRTGSIALTLKRLGDYPIIPEHLAQKLRTGCQPKPFVDYLKTNWSSEMEAKVRGQKHYALATISGRRDLTEELADGTRIPLKPGRVWVMDDMSSNIPFWFEVNLDIPARGSGLARMIERHGCAVGRQGLYCWDWASGAWLGFDLVGRLRDAYQASDILRFLRKLIRLYGKPDQIVLERGIWKSRAISGWRVSETGLVEVADDWRIADMTGDELDLVRNSINGVGINAQINEGIRALGVEIIHAYTPRGKPIEGAFNYHQRIVPTFLERGEAATVNIGRHAGEFEWAARQMRRAGDGVFHARDLGFIHIDRLADVIWQAMLWEGLHDKARRDGKPLEILAQYLKSFPLAPATDYDLAAFLPEKRSRVHRGGSISVEVAGTVHEFLNPEVFALLPTGAKIDFAFDPVEPELGCAVYDAKGLLCWADYLPAGPVISARDRGDDAGPQLLKRYKLAHRTAARLLDLRGMRTVAVADQAGHDPRPITATVAPEQLPPLPARMIPATLSTQDSYAEMFGG